MVWKLGFIAVALFGVYASAIPFENEINTEQNENVFPINHMAKCAEEGGATGIINCAAMRALKSLQYYSKQSILEIVPGISLNSEDPNIQRIGKELTENDLPTDPIEKADKLFGLLLENSARVFSGRTLKVRMPEDVVESVSRALEEGRARKRRKGGKFPSFMLGLGAKMFSIVPAIIAGLALLSTKALIIAKLALILSVIIFVQNFASKGSSLLGGFGGGHGHGSTGFGSYGSYSPPTWTTNSIGGGGGSSYPYARSIDVADAQNLAYSHQKQV